MIYQLHNYKGQEHHKAGHDAQPNKIEDHFLSCRSIIHGRFTLHRSLESLEVVPNTHTMVPFLKQRNSRLIRLGERMAAYLLPIQRHSELC